MRTRKLGKSDVELSLVGLGCMGMSEFYGPANDEQSVAVIQHALDIGVRFFDTADMYGSGSNERLLGTALGSRRKEAVVATKFAVVRGADGSFQGVNGKPEYVQRACEASLERLGIDAIDLYYQHRVDPNVPIEDTVGAMARLVEQGKVRRLGLSECAPATLRRACKVHPIAAVQSEYSLWTRGPERELLATCKELGVTFVAYSPLGRGFLTGAIRTTDALAKNDFRRFTPRFQGDNFEKNLQLVEALTQLVSARGVTPAQLALAWVLRQENVVAIPGTRSKSRVDENAAAADITLTAAELAQLDAAFPERVAAGERYPDMRGVEL